MSKNAEVSGTGNVLLKLLIQFLPAITMAVLNGALPVIFQKVVIGEEYTTAFIIKITLIRSVTGRILTHKLCYVILSLTGFLHMKYVRGYPGSQMLRTSYDVPGQSVFPPWINEILHLLLDESRVPCITR